MVHPVPSEWQETILKNCEGMKIDDKGAELENFVRFNLAFTVVGTYVGLIFEQKYMNTRQCTSFYQTSILVTILRSLMGFLIFSPILSSVFLFPKTYHWFIVLLGRTVVPVGLGNFYLFALTKWLSLKAGLAISKETSDKEQQK
jgi:hypothetical protein